MKNYVAFSLALGLFISGLVAFDSNAEAQALQQNKNTINNTSTSLIADSQRGSDINFEGRGYHMDYPRHYANDSSAQREMRDGNYRNNRDSYERHNRDYPRHMDRYEGHGYRGNKGHWNGESHWEGGGHRGGMRHNNGWAGWGHGGGRHHRR